MSLRPRASALAPVGARPVRPARQLRLDAVLAAGRARSGASTGEFYAVPPDEADERGRDALTFAPTPADAARENVDATFRLPFPESAPKNADGSYKYRVYDGAMLWDWVKREGNASDPLDRTPLLRSDWEALRDRYSSAAADPTPAPSVFRRPITNGLWPPPSPPPPPPPLTDATIRKAVQAAMEAGGPEYAHPVYGPIANWDVRNVTSTRYMFKGAFAFNGDLSKWKVGSVTHMEGMFSGAASFDGDLSGWDVSNVTSTRYMFKGAFAFNGDLSDWKVGSVTDMEGMFEHAKAFNCNLSRWDVSNVTNMRFTFEGAAAFDGDLSLWDVDNVTDMQSMFKGAASFDGDLSGWDVRNVTDTYGMFEGAVAYRPAHALGSRRLRLDAVSVASGRNALV
jgi:surface protein